MNDEKTREAGEGAQCAAGDEVHRQAGLLECGGLADVLDAVALPVLVFNRQRQVVFCNGPFLEYAQATDRSEVLGQRLGEALGCSNHLSHEGGCGGTRFCRHCGAARAILAALEGRADTQECLLDRKREDMVEGLNFQVWARPVQIGGEEFVINTLVDVRHEKRLQFLDRLFFHDLRNLSYGIKDLCLMVRDFVEEEVKSDIDIIVSAVNRLNGIIESQADFVAAEKNDYKTRPLKVGSMLVMLETLSFYERQDIAHGKSLAVDPASLDVALVTDRKLLGRVLDNLVKNALEATPAGGEVTLGCREEGGRVEFWVRNPGEMPEQVRAQIFRRAFTTKELGRGLGTYSVKLFTENYLGGETGFASTAEAGTTFWVRLPLALD